MSPSEYTYPVNEFYKALNALKLSIDVSAIDHLYVDFDSVRSDSSLKKLLLRLGIFNGKVNEDVHYSKILYTGHTGCGKSTELLKLHHNINRKDQYFSVYLDIDDYIQVTDFKSEDLMVIMISALVNELESHKINYGVPGLQKIAADWLSDTELNEEVKSKIESEGGVSGEIGTGSLLKLFSAKAFMKAVFSYGSQTSRVVRRKIQEKQSDYIDSFKLAIKEIRDDIRRSGNGMELIFIIDGLEKLRLSQYVTYTQTFFHNDRLINDLNCSIICCVPIDTLYDTKTSQVLTNYSHFTLPLIPINEDTTPLFSQIIARRINKDLFFEDGVLDYCVQKSGGSPRQLLKIVELSLLNQDPDNLKITMANAVKTCKKLGLDIFRRFTSDHIITLKQRNYDNANPVTLDLLFSLSLMEYNGELNNRQPNPLLIPFLSNDEH